MCVPRCIDEGILHGNSQWDHSIKLQINMKLNLLYLASNSVLLNLNNFQHNNDNGADIKVKGFPTAQFAGHTQAKPPEYHSQWLT